MILNISSSETEKILLADVFTVSVDVHGAGVSLPVVVRVRLVRVAVIRAVVTAVAHVVAVVVVLPRVVDEWTVVLLERRGREVEDVCSGAAGGL